MEAHCIRNTYSTGDGCSLSHRNRPTCELVRDERPGDGRLLPEDGVAGPGKDVSQKWMWPGDAARGEEGQHRMAMLREGLWR